MGAGVRVHDIVSLCRLWPYFAQFDSTFPPSPWSRRRTRQRLDGVKMGAQRPVTFGPEEMGRLKEIVLSGKFRHRGRRLYRFVENFARAISTISRAA